MYMYIEIENACICPHAQKFKCAQALVLDELMILLHQKGPIELHLLNRSAKKSAQNLAESFVGEVSCPPPFLITCAGHRQSDQRLSFLISTPGGSFMGANEETHCA